MSSPGPLEPARDYLLPGEKKKLAIQSQLAKDLQALNKTKACEAPEKDSLEDLRQRMENLEPKDVNIMTNQEREEYQRRQVVNEEFDQMYRKEKMLKQKIIYDKQCTSCKLIAGSLFMGATTFHAWRISQIWKFYRTPEKAFNVFMIGVLASISLLNFNAAYEIHSGKNMKMEESRPDVQLRQGYKERLTEAIAF